MLTLVKNGIIVDSGLSFAGSLLINGEKIEKIFRESDYPTRQEYMAAVDAQAADKTIDATGLHIIPGVIDDQVHFREPGNTQKATMSSESAAAVLGGVTSFMDMPNNNPPAAALSLAMVAFWVLPGSRKCTWSSITPGIMCSPVASIVLSAACASTAAMYSWRVG